MLPWGALAQERNTPDASCSWAGGVHSAEWISSAQYVAIIERSPESRDPQSTFTVASVLRAWDKKPTLSELIQKTRWFDVRGFSDLPAYWLLRGGRPIDTCLSSPRGAAADRYVLIFGNGEGLALSVAGENDRTLAFVRSALDRKSSGPLFTREEFLSHVEAARAFDCPGYSKPNRFLPRRLDWGFGDFPSDLASPASGSLSERHGGFTCARYEGSYVGLLFKGDWPPLYLKISESGIDFSDFAPLDLLLLEQNRIELVQWHPPRDSWWRQFLRRWSHEQVE